VKTILFIAVAVSLACIPARAEELFRECDEVLSDNSYKPLQEYLSKTSKPSNLCQRLNRREFLYTDDRNFYYCKVDNRGVLSCEEDERGHWYPDLSVAGRFSGKNGKKYVLLKTSRLSHGVFGSGYHAFFLVPKSVNDRGYVIFTFADAGEANGLYSDGGQICSNMGDDDAVASTSIPFQVLHQHSSGPTIRFNQEITSCKSGEKSIQTLEYTWQNNGFEKTLDKKEVVGPRRTRDRLKYEQKGK